MLFPPPIFCKQTVLAEVYTQQAFVHYKQPRSDQEADGSFDYSHNMCRQTDIPLQAAIHAMEEKRSNIMEWAACKEQRAVEASSQVQRAEQTIEKLTVS